MSVIDPKQTFAACDQGHSAKVFTGLLHRAPIDALSLGADKRRETMADSRRSFPGANRDDLLISGGRCIVLVRGC